jgi:hypothetical protein
MKTIAENTRIFKQKDLHKAEEKAINIFIPARESSADFEMLVFEDGSMLRVWNRDGEFPGSYVFDDEYEQDCFNMQLCDGSWICKRR